MPSLTLYSLHVSPWSERARWALDHHGLSYRLVQHMPVLGERRLRKVVGPGRPRATVPVLVADGETLCESWDIARRADRLGSGSKLVPEDREAEIRTWNDLADRTMQGARALVIASMLATPAALDESGPPAVPAFVRPLARPLARQAMKAFARKYALALDDLGPARAAMREGLDAVRKARGSRSYLLDTFTYADVVAATLLQGISPVEDRFLPLGPGTRAAWTQPDLAKEYADLVAWRDETYARERKARRH